MGGNEGQALLRGGLDFWLLENWGELNAEGNCPHENDGIVRYSNGRLAMVQPLPEGS